MHWVKEMPPETVEQIWPGVQWRLTRVFQRGRRSPGAAQRARGRTKVNLAPPAEDSAEIFPPWASTMPLAM